MVINEWSYIFLIPISGMLFAVGGTGHKWTRRWVLPMLLAMYHHNFWIFSAQVIAMHLPYGDSLPERYKWLLRGVIFSAYVMPYLLINWSIWLVMTPVLLLVLFYVSNTRWGEKIVTWKLWELTAGFLMAISLLQIGG